MPHRDPNARRAAILAWKDQRRPQPETQIDPVLPPRGVVIFSNDGEYVQCHICGVWKRALTMHVRRIHGTSIANYKEIYGIGRQKSLWPPALQEVQRAAALARDQASLLTPFSVDNQGVHPKGLPWRLGSRVTKSAARRGIAPHPSSKKED